MVVMAIIARLMSIAAPRYFNHLDRARETALRETLVVMRDSIDKFHGDTGRYLAELEELVVRH
jgi:general secretion pathway protein G